MGVKASGVSGDHAPHPGERSSLLLQSSVLRSELGPGTLVGGSDT